VIFGHEPNHAVYDYEVEGQRRMLEDVECGEVCRVLVEVFTFRVDWDWHGTRWSEVCAGRRGVKLLLRRVPAGLIGVVSVMRRKYQSEVMWR